jgi:hypothetical protein
MLEAWGQAGEDHGRRSHPVGPLAEVRPLTLRDRRRSEAAEKFLTYVNLAWNSTLSPGVDLATWSRMYSRLRSPNGERPWLMHR